MATMQDTRRSSRQNLSHLSLGKPRAFRVAATPKQQTQIGRAIALLRDAQNTDNPTQLKYNCSEAYRMLYRVLSEAN